MRTALLALAMAAAPVWGGSLTTADRDTLLSNFERSTAAFTASLNGLSDAQWNYKATPDRWSIAECAEHIAESESFIRGFIEKAVFAGGTKATPEAKKDDAIMKFIVNREQKFQAPEPLKPVNKYKTPAEALAAFNQSRAKNIALIKSHDDLRDVAGMHPAFKEVDGYGWFLFLSGHTLRHTAQIEEVKASAGYPKN
jgi:hypothetical protein